MPYRDVPKDLLAELVDGLAEGVVVVDADGTHLLVNRAFLDMTGFSREELVGRGTPHPYWPPEHLEKIIGDFRTTMGGSPEPFELTFRRKDETRFPVLVSPARVPASSGEAYVIATVTDQTASAARDEQLDESRLLIETMVRAGALGWWMWHLAEGWARTSDSYFEVMGWKAGSWSPSYEEWAKRVHPDDIGAADQTMRALIAGESDLYESEHRFVTEDGEWRWMLARGLAMERSATGEAILIAGTVQDMDRARRQEEKIQQFYKMELVGQMAGGIAHDFNNLLMAMSGNLELIDTDATPEVAPEVEEIRLILERASDLTRSLLQYARSDVADTELSVFDMCEALRALKPVARRTVGASANLEWHVTQGPCLAELPRAQFDSAILNLVMNARDALNPPPGTIRIEAEIEIVRPSGAPRSGVASGPVLSVRVHDTGVGMSAKVLEQALDPLFTTKPPGRGTGLGLSMVRKFVDQAGGDVHIRSQEGQGCTVTLRFPLREELVEDAMVTEEPDVLPANPASGTRVLVTDDEPAVLRVMERQLTHAGYEVETSANPRRALSILAESDIDVLVTDIVMPFTLDGVDLAERAAAMRPELRILFMSGYSDHERLTRAAAIGQVLHKPFSIRDLLAAIAEEPK